MNTDNALLTVSNLVKHFDISGGLLEQLSWENWRIVRRKTTVKAVNDVSFTIMPGEILGRRKRMRQIDPGPSGAGSISARQR